MKDDPNRNPSGMVTAVEYRGRCVGKISIGETGGLVGPKHLICVFGLSSNLTAVEARMLAAAMLAACEIVERAADSG